MDTRINASHDTRPAGGAADAAALPAPAAPSGDALYRTKATEAAVKFESFFIGTMLHKMRESARSVGDRDKQQDSINSDMLDMADNLVADQLAGRRAFGIADAILRQLLPPAPPPAAPTSAQNSGSATNITGNKANNA